MRHGGKGRSKDKHAKVNPGHAEVESLSDAVNAESDAVSCGRDEVDQRLEADDNGSDAKYIEPRFVKFFDLSIFG
jgi:hypothetical protein